MTTTTYSISGMHCGGCVRSIFEAIKKVAGVDAVTVSLESETVSVDGTPDVQALAQAVERAGDYALNTTPAADRASADHAQHANDDAKKGFFATYRPLLIIVGYILLGSTLPLVVGTFTLEAFMANFMAGFFLVFSFFKMLDVRGFASGFRSYDLVARVVPAWGYLYPFVELTLGIAYLTRFEPVATNAVTLVVMVISSVGIIKSMLNKRAIKCACLGTVIDLPLGTISLVEDLLMAAMAAVMLVMYLT